MHIGNDDNFGLTESILVKLLFIHTYILVLFAVNMASTSRACGVSSRNYKSWSDREFADQPSCDLKCCNVQNVLNPIDPRPAASGRSRGSWSGRQRRPASILLNHFFEVAASFGYILNQLNVGLLPFGYELWVNTTSVCIDKFSVIGV